MINNTYQSFLDKEFVPQGRPVDYPTPERKGLLFFIQRNHNTNTVVYEMNTTSANIINLDEPMKIYWIEYDENMEEVELNFIQNKLAFGYDANVINNDLIEFRFVSYEKRFFIEKFQNSYRVITKINGENSVLKNIYVYAEEFGVFPVVKFIELYGTSINTNLPNFEKIPV
jgi:hypothetical protein